MCYENYKNIIINIQTCGELVNSGHNCLKTAIKCKLTEKSHRKIM